MFPFFPDWIHTSNTDLNCIILLSGYLGMDRRWYMISLDLFVSDGNGYLHTNCGGETMFLFNTISTYGTANPSSGTLF